MTKYQFIVFLQGSEVEEIENEIRECFDIDQNTAAIQWYEEKEKAIELLSQWDYGEYYTDSVSYDDFRHEIGTSADIYESDNSDYILVTYGLLSDLGLYRKITE